MREFRTKRPAKAITVDSLGGNYGKDRGRKLVVTLGPGDLIIMRPQGTRREMTLSVFDAYHYAIRCKVNLERLEKAREAKSRKAERLARKRLDSAERRFKLKLVGAQ